MRLTKGNIRSISVIEKDGVPYNWYVECTSGNVSDARCFHNIDDRGRSTDTEYSMELLPKTVQAYIREAVKTETKRGVWNGSEYIHSVYKVDRRD